MEFHFRSYSQRQTSSVLWLVSEMWRHIKKELLKRWEELPPVFVTSSEKGTGRQELLDYIYSINQEISKTE